MQGESLLLMSDANGRIRNVRIAYSGKSYHQEMNVHRKSTSGIKLQLVHFSTSKVTNASQSMSRVADLRSAH